MKNGALRLQSFIVSLLFPKAEPKFEPYLKITPFNLFALFMLTLMLSKSILIILLVITKMNHCKCLVKTVP